MLCAEKGTFPSTVAASIGLSNAAATGWKNGKQPRQRVINQLAAALGCAVDDLMEKEKPTVQDDGLTQKQREFIALVPFLPDDVVSILLAVAKNWLDTHTAQDTQQ